MNLAKKVVSNTAILYLKTILTAGLSLYSVRLVLRALGEVDYGIFCIVGGVISMLAFLSSAMTVSTQRFLSFHFGKKDLENQKIYFFNSLAVHVLIGIVLFLALKLLGYYLFKSVLNIPADRVEAGMFIYQYMIITVFFTIISVPFSASIIANEDMIWIAVVESVDVLLKLLISASLVYVTGDLLKFYGMFVGLVSVVLFLLYSGWSFLKYKECVIDFKIGIRKPVMIELVSYTGWNLFGAMTSLGKTQGVAILLNVFNGAAINASYGIANQVSSQMNFFSQTMLKVLNPQIMKSEGAGDRKQMIKLSFIASKFGFYLLAFVAIPCIFEMKHILKLWLGNNVSDHTVKFCVYILLAVMANQLTVGLDSAIQATGRIRGYMILVGFTKLLVLPFGYVILLSGYKVEWVMIGYILFEGLGGTVRLYMLRNLVSTSLYLREVILRVLVPTGISLLIMLVINHYRPAFGYSIFYIILYSVIFILMIGLFGMSAEEKKTLKGFTDGVFQRIRKFKQA